MKYSSDVLKRPTMTEKSLLLADSDNVYTFFVDVRANKTEVKKAVEEIFDVVVENVNIVNVRAKTKRMGKYVGKTTKKRKAMVKLAKGNKIKLFDEE